MSKRQWTATELNHLLKFGFDPFQLAESVDLHIPVEYITGKAEFSGHIFAVNPDVLIPRIETEEMISLALEYVLRHQLGNVSFADVATGSGAIGISFYLELIKDEIKPTVVMSDISEAALQITRQNIASLIDQSNDVSVIKSDLLQDYPVGTKFDLILANLPYIPSSRLQNLDISVRDFEPKLALDGGPDGLNLIRKLLQQSTTWLAKDGQVILEVDDTHVDSRDITDWNIEVRKDSLGRNRFWIAQPK